jgi:hypothetical protein
MAASGPKARALSSFLWTCQRMMGCYVVRSALKPERRVWAATPTSRLSFSLRQRLCDFAGSVDEKLRDGA